jgi:transposase-like protein
VRGIFPAVAEQRCWNHRLVNVLDALPQKLQAEARALVTKVAYAESRAEAERLKRAFETWATKEGVWPRRGAGSTRTGSGW